MATLSVLVACTAYGPKGRFALAEKLWSDAQYSAAVTEYEKVYQQEPAGQLGIQALFKQAMTETLYLGRHEASLSHFKTLIDETSHGTAWAEFRLEARKQIADIYFSKLEQYELSNNAYQSLFQELKDPEFLYRIAKGHFLSSQFNESIKTNREVIKQFPHSPQAERAELDIAKAYYTMGGPESSQEAMSQFNRFQKNHPTSAYRQEALLGIAMCLEELEQYDAAQKQYEELVATYPVPQIPKIRLERIKQRRNQKTR